MADGSYGMGGGPVPPLTKAWLWGFLFGIVVGALVVLACSFAFAEEQQTNGSRGMLRYGEAFGPTPKVKLCEVTEHGVVKLRACPAKPRKK